ncbi:hypothetical protein J2W35_006925 [Variovorax boronicumulans]|uniref:hypothetical protein n=1 Tax=Variovorax boronicumulans TaxID=436515 RepID=UPI00278736CD|nr:hypothetical protein [Variovorax boronicumulans]MDQ0086542.1 hypothetical protein [Variovorax boronicumulans]
MNVALPALIVFALVLPGFVFRDRFKRNEKTALDYAPFGRVVAEAVMWASFLHGIWLLLAWLARDQVLHIDVLLGLLSSNTVDQAKAIAFVHSRGDWLAEYFASLLLASFAVPSGLRWLITRCRLDRYGYWLSPWVRFHNAPWYYLLTGADFTKEELPDYINVSAIVNIAGAPYLYQGMLDDFFFASDGQLDRLILENVSRRPLSKDKPALPIAPPADPEADAAGDANATADMQTAHGGQSTNETASPDTALPEQRFYPIDGDSFVLRMSEAITLNVQYVKLNDRQALALTS